MKELKLVYGDKVVGSISGWDRIRFRGTIRWLANTRGIGSFMCSRGILLKDFGKWAEGVTKTVRKTCAEQAARMEIPMIYLRSSGVVRMKRILGRVHSIPAFISVIRVIRGSLLSGCIIKAS